VLVTSWATWCPPCRARFPHFVETHRVYKDKGLMCVSVNMDKAWPQGREYSPDKVLSFLKDKGATFANYVAVDRDDGELARHFGLGNSIPHMALFGKDGRRVWDSQKSDLDDREIAALVERELAK
jgi:thiol-disulfide isomerase/thioredoxin